MDLGAVLTHSADQRCLSARNIGASVRQSLPNLARAHGQTTDPHTRYTLERLPNSSLVSRQLTSTRMVLCASPTYLRTHGKHKHPSDLAQHDVLAYSLLSMGDQWYFTAPEGVASVKV